MFAASDGTEESLTVLLVFIIIPWILYILARLIIYFNPRKIDFSYLISFYESDHFDEIVTLSHVCNDVEFVRYKLHEFVTKRLLKCNINYKPLQFTVMPPTKSELYNICSSLSILLKHFFRYFYRSLLYPIIQNEFEQEQQLLELKLSLLLLLNQISKFLALLTAKQFISIELHDYKLGSVAFDKYTATDYFPIKFGSIFGDVEINERTDVTKLSDYKLFAVYNDILNRLNSALNYLRGKSAIEGLNTNIAKEFITYLINANMQLIPFDVNVISIGYEQNS